MKWVLQLKNTNEIKRIQDELGIPALIANILINKGIKNIQQIKSFLSDNLSNLHDPFFDERNGYRSK